MIAAIGVMLVGVMTLAPSKDETYKVSENPSLNSTLSNVQINILENSCCNKDWKKPLLFVTEISEISKQRVCLHELIVDILGKPESVYTALTVAIRRESNWNQSAIGVNFNKKGCTATTAGCFVKSRDWGLFQINDKTWDLFAESKNLDYKNSWQDNLVMGTYVYYFQGMSAWTSMHRYK